VLEVPGLLESLASYRHPPGGVQIHHAHDQSEIADQFPPSTPARLSTTFATLPMIHTYSTTDILPYVHLDRDPPCSETSPAPRAVAGGSTSYCSHQACGYRRLHDAPRGGREAWGAQDSTRSLRSSRLALICSLISRSTTGSKSLEKPLMSPSPLPVILVPPLSTGSKRKLSPKERWRRV
jgi:hypothetical protein